MNNAKKIVRAIILMRMVLIYVYSVAAITKNQNEDLHSTGNMLQIQTREQLDGNYCK